MSAGPYYFDESYQEEVLLGDGTPVRLRTIRPSDKELLRAGFAELSPTSRYLRFFTPKQSLDEEELRALTELDGVNQFALGAASLDGKQGLGVARFVRSEDLPEVAEAAVTVLDCAQGKGLGTLLLQRLAAAARERGVLRFRCEFLAGNRRVQRLLEQRAGVSFEKDGDLVRAEVPVPEEKPGQTQQARDRGNATYDFLVESARGAIKVRFRKLLLKWSS